MFWKKTPKVTIESEIRRALDAGVSAKMGYGIDYPFRWARRSESIEERLNGLTDLAVAIRQKCRDYPMLYSRGPLGTFSYLLDDFLSDENFKKNILQETIGREVEVQRSIAMVEAVRNGQDTQPGFLALVEAKSLDDIRRAQKSLR